MSWDFDPFEIFDEKWDDYIDSFWAEEPSDVWTTATGQRLRVSEMGTSHLINCIAMLRRTADRNSGGFEDWQTFVPEIYWLMIVEVSKRNGIAAGKEGGSLDPEFDWSDAFSGDCDYLTDGVIQ